MPAKKMPFRKVLPPACPPTHFTMEDARRAVREVMEEDRQAAAADTGRVKEARGGAVSTRSAA